MVQVGARPPVLADALARNLHARTLKEENLALRRVVREVQLNLPHVVKHQVTQACCRHQYIAQLTRQEVLLGPLMDEVADLARLNLGYHIAHNTHILRRAGHPVMQFVEAVKPQEIQQAHRVHRVFLCARLSVHLLGPELGRQGNGCQVLEVLVLVTQLNPVAEVLAGFSPAVTVLANPFRQPHRVHVQET